MRLSHARRAVSVRFDDPNLVSCAGLAAAKGGANATAKVLALVAGMVTGADSISDMDLLRHGAMGRLFTDIRAPWTLGTFLRLFSFGHVRQLDAVAARFLARLATATPILPAPTRSLSSTSTTPSGLPTATPNKAPGAATPASTDSTRCWPRSALHCRLR